LQNYCQHPIYYTLAYSLGCSLNGPKYAAALTRTRSPLRERNRTTLVAEALLKGEEVELVRKAIELAKTGDAQMLKFLLDRILPKERSVRVDLAAMDGDFSPVEACGAIVAAVGTGQIAPNEAAALASLLTACARIMEVTEFGERLENIEKDLRALKKS
jgi:hypothetical protein